MADAENLKWKQRLDFLRELQASYFEHGDIS
jgi:hypothetical protein